MATRTGRRRAVRLVGLPSPYAPPMSRFRPITPTVLMPQHEKPFWHRSVTLAPPRAGGGRVLAHRAPVRDEIGAEELCTSPPPPSFLDSDGVPVDILGRKATHSFAVPCRTSIVSADWVHTQHTNPARSWRLRFPAALCASGDIFFGCTEATSFEHPGMHGSRLLDCLVLHQC